LGLGQARHISPPLPRSWKKEGNAPNIHTKKYYVLNILVVKSVKSLNCNYIPAFLGCLPLGKNPGGTHVLVPGARLDILINRN
jgi:hypothetical protein